MGGWLSEETYVCTYLVEIEDDVKLADVAKVAVQDLHEEVDHLVFVWVVGGWVGGWVEKGTKNVPRG